MTIKQQGGVFGRNPTFNTVEAETVTANGYVSTGNMTFGDNDQLIFGAGADLKIFHDGSNSKIQDLGTGNLRIEANTLELRATNGDYFATFDYNGGAFLYYNSNEKLATTNTGVSVTGDLAFASGNGIDFSATSGTGTSELFDDYEEGTFTPTVTSGSGTFTTVSASGAYTLIGRKVFLHGRITITDAGTASGTLNITLPFTNIVYDAAGSAYEYAAVGFSAAIRVSALASTANLIKYDGTTAIGTGNRLSYAIAYNI